MIELIYWQPGQRGCMPLSRLGRGKNIKVADKTLNNTPGTAGGPGGRDRTLAVKSRKNVRKITFFS